MTQHWTVVIVGGGPAASATAIQLGRSGMPALIVEKGDDRGDKIGETIPPDASPLLARVGIADRLADGGHLPAYGNRSMWGSAAPVEQSFITSPYGSGWHLDRRRFERALIDVALAAGAERMAATTVTKWRREPRGWWLELSSQEAVTTRFVVDATGRPSWFARRQGARREREDALLALVMFLKTDDIPDPDSYTFVEATEAGWWYSTTIPDHRLATAFITEAALLDRAALTVEGWETLLATAPHTASRVAGFGYKPSGRPATADASGSILEPIRGDGWAAVGDAAAAFDPLSSYGITGALAGGLALGRAIAAGSPAALESYAADVAKGFAAYRAMRREYYAIEQRWPDSRFWAHRS